MNRVVFGLVVGLFVLSACKKHDITSSMKGCKVQEIEDFDYLSLRSRINYTQGESKFSFVANIRIKKDSVIWISAGTGTGVEAIRCVLRQDSIIVMDKLEKKCFRAGISSLKDRYGYQIDYLTLQRIILGNVAFVGNKKPKLSKEGDFCVASQSLNPFKIIYYVSNETKKLEKIEVREPGTENQLNINYSDFKKVDDNVIPHDIEILLDYKNEANSGNIKLEVKQRTITFSQKPLKFPFRIPEKYECN